MNIKMLACAAFGMMLTANVFAQEEDMTHYIVNAGFDEDITFNADGTAATEITATGATTSRSAFYKSENGSLYAWPTDNKGFNVAGANSWYGFIGYMKGWEVTNETQTPEWIYFGSVPYDVQHQMLGVGDGNPAGSIESPGKPEGHEGDDNKAALYFRAGWGGKCTYKQVVKLPCAEYRLEYWSINANPNTTATATNLTNVTCRKDVFTDETGLNDAVWTKHEIIFTPTTEFTIEFGYQAAGSVSSGQPFVFIDGIKLYKIGEADQEELMTSDLMDQVDELYNLMGDERLIPFTGLQNEMSDKAMEAEEASTVEEMEAAIANLKAYIASINELFPVIDEYNVLYKKGESISETGNYPGIDAFLAAFNKLTGEIAQAYTDEFVAKVAELKTALHTYYFSQVASVDSPADYTFLVSNPHFVKLGYEPTYAEGVATYPVEEEITATPEWASSEGWYKGSVTSGDQRLNWAQGRVCWNLWDTAAGLHAISMDLTDLPNGYYTISADFITQPDWVGEGFAHAYVQSSANKAVSPNLTEGNWDGSMEWTTLTTEKVIVADGKLTIGGESNFPGGNQTGWFCMTNVKLYYLGGFSEEDYKVIYNKAVADAQAMCDTMYFKGDKKIFSDSIAAYSNATTVDEMTVALAHLNAAHNVAKASQDKYNAVSHPNTGSWGNLKDSIAANVYTAEGTKIAQKIVDIMAAYVAADTASYVYMDGKTAVLRKYRDAYLPALTKAQKAVYNTEAAKNVLAVNIDAHIAELTAITDFPTEAEMDAYTAELNAAIAEADRLELLNSQKPGENVDFTALIKNADVNSETGWVFNKGNGNTNTNSGQEYDGGNGRYIDSWAGSGLSYTAYQTLDNIPNGTYELKAMTRTTGVGSYLYVIADEDSANAKFQPLKMNDDINLTQWVDPMLKNEAGTDSLFNQADMYGPIWQDAVVYVRDVLGIHTLTDELGNNLVLNVDGWLADEVNKPTETDMKYINIAKVNNGAGRGWAWHSVQVEVKNHVLTLGVTTDSVFTEGYKDVTGAECVAFTGQWFSADNFTLTMLKAGDNTGWDPTATGIENVTGTENAVPVAIYSISGVRVATPAKGINIIKMSDGTVKKVLVK